VDETHPYEHRRQDGRVHMRVPVELRVSMPDGTLLEEDTHTGVVGVMGAMIRMSRSLEIGAEVELTNHFSQQTAKFRVVWVNAPSDDDLWDIGIESIQPLGDFWGVRFPARPDTR
jgi:hypothetical protein